MTILPFVMPQILTVGANLLAYDDLFSLEALEWEYEEFF